MQKIRVVLLGLNFGTWILENELMCGEAAQCIQLVGVCDLERFDL